MIFGRLPAFWIGLIVSIALGILQTLTGQGLISEAMNGTLNNLINGIGQLLILASPLIAGLLIHPLVTPTSDPALAQGTVVTVLTPGDLPNTSKIL
jgi:hypothetical protein